MRSFSFHKKTCLQRLWLVAVILMCLLLVRFPLQAQWQTMGAIQQCQRDGSGLKGVLSNGFFRIDVYNAHTIRVRVQADGNFSGFSYVLADTILPLYNEWHWKDSAGTIRITTPALRVSLDKYPFFRVTFSAPDGTVLNEDMPGNGFATSSIGQRVTLYKKLQKGERFVGLGEVLGNLDKRGSGFTLNNTDTYKYGDPRLSMYTSIPFYMGVHGKAVYGIFFHNTHKSFFNFGQSTPDFMSITADAGSCDYFFMHDAEMAGILRHYTALTGRMPLPPRWSMGYHQSRCSYYPQLQVELLAENFRKKDLPIDCIVLDADYLYEYEPFRINTQRFPDLRGLADRLKKMHIELTASVNPGIKIDTTYAAYHDGRRQDIFVKYANGDLFTSDIWPNTNHFPDFTQPAARAWWIDQMKFLPDNGIHGYWNDMNEPAVGGSYLPDNLLFDFDGRKATALEAKNLYGFLMARSSYESAVKYGGNRRPFVLTRSGFAGVQRYAAVWTGDNTAKDEYLLGGALLNMQMGLSGVPFVGDDIGGYIGPANKELFTRWMQVGMFSPFARNHKEAWSHANEPWAFGEETEAIVRAFMKFRYRLMPYLYSAFYEASQSGMPVVRSLCMQYPFDEKVYHPLYQYQFMCGSAFLVIPVTGSEKIKSFYLPQGNWYNLYTGELTAGGRELQSPVPLHQIPVYVKASSVVPMQTDVMSAKDKPADTLRLHVYYGNDKNVYTWYDDDGETLAYKQGQFTKRNIVFDPVAKALTVEPAEGKRTPHFRHIAFVLHGFPASLHTFSINKKRAAAANREIHVLDAMQYLEDIYDKTLVDNLRKATTAPVVRILVAPYEAAVMQLQWE